MKPYDLYAMLIEKFGEENMIRVAIEEMAELTKELTKYTRKDTSDYNTKAITEEMADVCIAMKELMWLFKNEQLVEQTEEEKYCRTMERIKEM